MHIGLATSDDGLTWTKYAGNPVLEAGEAGEWDDGYVYGPEVIFNGSTYEMWYGGMHEWLGFSEVGYATSADGIEWTKHPGNPVMSPTPDSWDEAAVWPRTTLFDGERYRMWYSGALGGTPSPQSWDIGYAESVDGVSWVKHPVPVLSGGVGDVWDHYVIWDPDVHYDGSTYQMWYTGLNYDHAIGYATSPDGIHWAKYAHNPVLQEGEYGEWDSSTIQTMRVLFEGETAHMWYTGDNGEVRAIGYASAPLGSFAPPALQLNNGRFQVDVVWWDDDFVSVDAMPVQLTRDTGCFWFFDEDNVEVLIKVLDACTVSDHYWVFVAGLTNMGVSIQVTDLETGEVWWRGNGIGQTFETVLDNQAFATCP
jgi:predicted GH43/DUF377 family glycosyl hydrolase